MILFYGAQDWKWSFPRIGHVPYASLQCICRFVCEILKNGNKWNRSSRLPDGRRWNRKDTTECGWKNFTEQGNNMEAKKPLHLKSSKLLSWFKLSRAPDSLFYIAIINMRRPVDKKIFQSKIKITGSGRSERTATGNKNWKRFHIQANGWQEADL